MSDTYEAVPCTRCGMDITLEALARRKTRNDPSTLCKDCDAAPRAKVGMCRPWVGDVDLDTMQPLDERGRPFMVGERQCGNADCINANHIISDDPAVLRYKRDVKESHALSRYERRSLQRRFGELPDAELKKLAAEHNIGVTNGGRGECKKENCSNVANRVGFCTKHYKEFAAENPDKVQVYRSPNRKANDQHSE
jgi:hypothetical protein